MFEFSIAKKYLLPKRGQLPVSLIALMSVIVISLVVWLMLLFLSITDGIERGWLNKLTALNGPIRITPTPEYFNSYYYQIDTFSSASNYSPKSIGQKASAPSSNPYAPDIDMELPRSFPQPKQDPQGYFIDPVKRAFQVLDDLQLTYQDYEIGGAMMRLQMLRSPSGNLRDLDQHFLTQVTYVTSFSDHNPKLSDLLLPATPQDVEHLLLMSAFEQVDSIDAPDGIERSTSAASSARIEHLLRHMEITQLKSEPFWEIPKHLLPSNFRCPAQIVLQGKRVAQIILASETHGSQGTLVSENNSLFYTDAHGSKYPLEPSSSIISEQSIVFDATVNSKQIPNRAADLRFSLKGQWRGLTLKGESKLEGLKISRATSKQTSSTCLEDPKGVWLPKQFQDGGVLVGDTGFLLFSAQGASSVQEQRLPITVLGFYDPGIMAIGNKCILAPSELVHSLNLANQSFQMDPSFASGIQVWIDDLSKAIQVKSSIENAFQKQGVDTYWKVTTYHDYDFAKDLLQQFQSDKTLFTLIGIIILGVACCNIISLLVLLVNDKKREIGILQAMGANTRSIACIFAFCGAGMGIISSLIGTGAALLTLQHIDAIAHFLSFLQGHDMFNAMFYGKTLPNSLSTDALCFVLIATPLLSLLAGLVPALKACRLRPSAVLRAES
ncbi:MAG: FtsX-like permease family protein [Anaplasmataceae bacterium]|nr:FtsX-like permease family protein [Anaplasmataceae bacterium]